MSVLVIGGTGFLGRHIVEKLISNGFEVTVLTRHPSKLSVFSKKVSFIKGNLLDTLSLDLTTFKQIINCSGEIHNEKIMQTLHVDSVFELLKKLKNMPNSHWIQISSVGVYGKIRQGVVTENTPFLPIGEYEITKAQSDSLVKEFCTENKIAHTIIRPSNVFGNDMPNRSLAQLVKMIRNNLFFYIGKDIDNIKMNYVHINDVSELVLICMSHPKSINQDFIISDQISLPAFVKVVSETLGIKVSPFSIPEGLIRFIVKFMQLIPRFPVSQSRIDALTSQAVYSTSKVRQHLGFQPSMGVTNGLKEFCTLMSSIIRSK